MNWFTFTNSFKFDFDPNTYHPQMGFTGEFEP